MLMHTRDAFEINTLGTLGLSQLASVFPISTIKEVLERWERATCRLRELPNELMFYFPMMMALNRSDNYVEILHKLLEGGQPIFGRRTEKTTGKSGISYARDRIKWEPLKEVFDSHCVPLVQKPQRFSHFEDMLLVAIDGVVVNVPDTPKNEEYFGRSGNQHAKSKYPQLRSVAAVECGTHATIGAEAGPVTVGESTLARKVIPRIPKGSLIIADRLYLGWFLVQQALAQSCKLLWRIQSKQKEERFEVLEELPDGSYKALYHPPKDTRELKADGVVDFNPITGRVCSYSVKGKNPDVVHLFTTLDEEQAPATKLAELYMQRWEVELVFNEMKVKLNENETTLRSGTPDLVMQEFYGLIMMHYALRSLIHEAAARAKLDPDWISFKGAMKVVRRKSLRGGSFSP